MPSATVKSLSPAPALTAGLDAIVVVVEARPAEATFPGKPGNIAYAGRDATGDTEI